MFRVPSLRNAATRAAFFHNGVLHRLEDVVRFYAERDTQPRKWYRRQANGRPVKFDDLPPQYRSNVDTAAPFGGHAGDAPAMSEADIKDIVAFLTTLTDGYRPH
jgi:cytochrome c peroxidase